MKAQLRLSLFTLTLIAQMGVARAQNYADFPGAVPFNHSRQAATDLKQGSKTLTPDEADRLRTSGTDLSTLDPEVSDLWSRTPKTKLEAPIDVRESGEVFEYLDGVPDLIGNSRFTVQRNDANGIARTYMITISKTSHNYLMRRALLQKMGYQTKDVRYLKKFRLKFASAFSRKLFVSKVKEDLIENEAQRWVTDPENESLEYADVQDAVIVSADTPVQDVAHGAMTSEFVAGRRVLNALLIPYNLVDTPESKNLYPWHTCRVENDMAKLPYSESVEFYPSLDDARWAAKLIAKLTREDFQQIVQAAHMPAEPSALVLEKLISRRNSLMACFKVSAPELPFNAKVSMGQMLVEGKLLKNDWIGYGSKFSNPDPVTPLTGGELRAFFKSRAIGIVIENLVNKVNADVIPKTDLAKAMYDRQVTLAQERFVNYLKTGRDQKTPFGIWVKPTYAGNLILSRDVVTGAYLGTDNMVQLADTVGFAVEGGVLGALEGLPAKLQVGGQLKGSFVRTYTHIKPIRSVKAAIKEPYRNIIVPLLKKDFAKSLNKVALLAPPKKDASDEEQSAFAEKVKKMMGEFKEQLGVGESLLISDSISGLGAISVGYGLTKDLQVQAALADSQVVIRRLHIFRKDADTIQIYRDPADYNILQASIGLNAYIPIFNFKFSRKAGEAMTHFYSMNVKADHRDNPELFKNVRALSNVLLTGSVDAVESIQKPFKIHHAFQEKASDTTFLRWRWLNLKTSDRIDARAPSGQTKSFVYWSEAKSSGKNYESLAADVVARLLEEATGDNELSVSTPGMSIPGQGIFGSAVTRRTSFESELAPSPSKNPVAESYIEIEYEWKGWEISREGIMKIIKEITDKFAFTFYPDNTLQSTKKVQLYSVGLRMSIYKDGIDTLARQSVVKFKEILGREGKYPFGGFACPPGRPCPRSPDESQRARGDRMMGKFVKAQKKYAEALAKNDVNEASEQGLKMVSAVETILSSRGLIEMIGGEKNLYVQSSIKGFRTNDENGDTQIISDTLGQIGSSKQDGPLRFVQQNLGMTESEFFLYWLLNQI